MLTTMRVNTIEEEHTSGAYNKRPLTLVRGEGSRMWDDTGRSYVDATSGMGVALLGHGHAVVAEAIAQQARTLITCPEIFYSDRRAELYELLASLTPGDLNRFFLCNSGAEAIEGALKIARLLTGREGIVAAKRSFHGRTMGALSMTWNPKYREAFQSWLPAVTHITYNDIEGAREAITNQIAAVVIEVVQGEGGVYPANNDYLQALRQICNERGALLIVDEIQTGFGRTGCWFAVEHAGITPDIMTLGKGIAGGVPMGVVCWRKTLGQIPQSSHGSTFGGNPLACAAAIATLTTLRDENLPQRAKEVGAWLISQLQALNLREVREIRGSGLIVGLELRGRVTPTLQRLQELGLLALPAGVNVLRLLPPLIIKREELQIAIEAIREALS